MSDNGTVQIYDPVSNKIRMVKDMEIKSYEMPAEDASGRMENVKGVHFIVVGKNREWPLWVRHDEFTKANPDIKVEG